MTMGRAVGAPEEEIIVVYLIPSVVDISSGVTPVEDVLVFPSDVVIVDAADVLSGQKLAETVPFLPSKECPAFSQLKVK